MMITAEEVAILGSLRTEINRLSAEVNLIEKVEDRIDPRGYGGKPIPCREGIEIDLPGDNTAKRSGTFVISADGPYVATSIHFAFKWTLKVYSGGLVSSVDGYWRPTTVPQFYWEYQVTGTQRRRQSVPVPSYVAARAEIGNGSFPLIPHDVMAKTSTVTIWITPICDAIYFYDYMLPDVVDFDSYDAKIWVGFNGFYLLD
jgi:hypothetical protein